MDLWADYQWFLTSQEKKQPDIIFLLMEAHSNSDEVVLLKKKKKKFIWMRLGFYQFVGKKKRQEHVRKTLWGYKWLKPEKLYKTNNPVSSAIKFQEKKIRYSWEL